jgi:metal-responsive CopG/Arc/MetJ family transcriptional regulator
MAQIKTTTLITVSLPRTMAERVEAVRKAEHRTRSELVREALRTYFALSAQFPEEEATPAELRAIERGRRAVARGQYVTLNQLLHELEPHRRGPGTKRT